MLNQPPLLSLTCLDFGLLPSLGSQLTLIVLAFSGMEIRKTTFLVLSFSCDNVHLYCGGLKESNPKTEKSWDLGTNGHYLESLGMEEIHVCSLKSLRRKQFS